MKRSISLLLLATVIVLSVPAQAPAAFAEKPVLLTSVGQSADIEMVKVLLNRAKVPYSADPLVQASRLPKEVKTLILAVGGSSKGLGAAGISSDAEIERAKALIKRAKELGLKIIVVHVGGEARRGTLSDAFISLCVPVADYVIMVADGDKDSFFTKLTGEAHVPLVKVEKISAVAAPLAAAFK